MYRDGDAGQANGRVRRDPFAALGDRVPPQNIEAEEGVLGSILLEDDRIDDVVEHVAAEDFYRDAHRTLFQTALAMRGAGKAVDALTVAEELTRLGVFRAVGGEDILGRVMTSVPHAANAVEYAQIVRQKAVARRVVEAASLDLEDCFSDNFSADQLLDAAERRVFAIRDRQSSGQTVRVAGVMGEVIAAVERRQDGEVTGLTSGLVDLDDMTCGFQPENLIYVAGRTSAGKTALCLGIAMHLSVDMRRPGLYVSAEMSRMELGERLAVMRAKADGHKVRTGRLDRRSLDELKRASEAVAAAPLFIDDTPGRNATQIAANARRLKAREQIQYVVVDLINRVEGENAKQNRREQMGEISFRLKALARELKIPVIVLAQLNRQPDARDGNRPRKSDLKECGNLEEDADMVILLHRPEYYDPGCEPGIAYVIVDKNRNGPTGDVKVTFQKQCMRFDNLYPDVAPGVIVNHTPF